MKKVRFLLTFKQFLYSGFIIATFIATGCSKKGIKQGSKNADKDPYQELKYSYVHTMLHLGLGSSFV